MFFELLCIAASCHLQKKKKKSDLDLDFEVVLPLFIVITKLADNVNFF